MWKRKNKNFKKGLEIAAAVDYNMTEKPIFQKFTASK
jgi:hypothetical protein